MALTVDILTIFPGMFSSVLGESILERAAKRGLVRVRITDIREFARDRHRSVDDRPYGGGPGMVFRPEPVVEAVESVVRDSDIPAGRTRFLMLCPQGRTLSQRDFRAFASADRIVLLCGHYEGFDERIRALLTGTAPAGEVAPIEPNGDASAAEAARELAVPGVRFEECSVGDYVLTGGELPAMTILDGVVRLLPGALGDPDSAAQESFENDLLDCPHFTRPPEFRGMRVPPVLLSGDHAKVEAWRRDHALRRTRERRADLLTRGDMPGEGIHAREHGARSDRARGEASE